MPWYPGTHALSLHKLNEAERIRGENPSLVQFSAMTNLTSALRQLEQERSSISDRLNRLNAAISALTGVGTNRKRRISVAGRARIAAAQRARWAKAKGQRAASIAGRRKHKISVAAVARIRAAQKARWAKWRKTQKRA